MPDHSTMYPSSYPGLIVNGLGYVLTANASAKRLFEQLGGDADLQSHKLHIVEVLFSDAGKSLLLGEWPTSTLRATALFDSLAEYTVRIGKASEEELNRMRVDLASTFAAYPGQVDRARTMGLPEKMERIVEEIEETSARNVSACNVYPVFKWGDHATQLTLNCMFHKRAENDGTYELTLVPTDPASESGIMLSCMPSASSISRFNVTDYQLNTSLLWARVALETVRDGLSSPTAPARFDPKGSFKGLLLELALGLSEEHQPDQILTEGIETCLGLCLYWGLINWVRTDGEGGSVDELESQRAQLLDVLTTILSYNGVIVQGSMKALELVHVGTRSGLNESLSRSFPALHVRLRDEEINSAGIVSDLSARKELPDLSEYFGDSKRVIHEWAAGARRESGERIARLEAHRGQPLPDISDHFTEAKQAFKVALRGGSAPTP